ncbi:MAG: GC-type dockerin domain-anchored protein [Phycisphaerales bacterium]|nr:GC-type dockerin domain-anchored protein [Phycisphaerales bacterium]
MNIRLLSVGAIATCSTFATAQSFNVEFGTPETSPSDTYAAVGLPGLWNTFSSMPNFMRLPLLGLDGEPIAADIMNIGFDNIESAENVSTFGDNESLLDDCFTSFNDPIDGCIFLRFVEPGEYQVIMYALAPDDDSLLSRLRIDQNEEEPEFVGGQWVGVHQDGMSYMSQIATVGSDGRLDIHSGLPSGNLRSILNGFQVVQLAPCQPDMNNDGDLNFFDVSAFLAAFGSQDQSADFNNDSEFNFFDVSSFLSAFGEGCP